VAGGVKRPEYVQVGLHRFTIRWDEAAMDHQRVLENEPHLDGNVRYSDCTITVAPDVTPTMQREILFHEIIHAVLSITGGNKFPKKASVDDILMRFDGVLLDVLQRNPDVASWLLAPAEKGPR
jgi:hypothetical protein